MLAAGLGLRMRPLSLRRAKPVMPVLNRPLLLWTLERLARHGVREAVVNLHHRPSTVVRALSDSGLGVRLRFSHERTILGTGGAPRRVREFFGDEPFLLVNGDVVFDFDLGALMERHLRSGARATLALKANPDPRTYGPVVTSGGGRIVSIAGLPRGRRGTVSLFTGIHVIDPSLLDRLPRGRSEIVTHLYAPLIAEGELLLGVRVKGAWYDLGNPPMYLASQLAMLAAGRGGPRRALVDPAARVAPDARVESSVVGPGAIVGAGATVVRSVLWERAEVGAGARVHGSILAAGVRVPRDRTVVDRVIARGTGGRLVEAAL